MKTSWVDDFVGSLGLTMGFASTTCRDESPHPAPTIQNRSDRVEAVAVICPPADELTENPRQGVASTSLLFTVQFQVTGLADRLRLADRLIGWSITAQVAFCVMLVCCSSTASKGKFKTVFSQSNSNSHFAPNSFFLLKLCGKQKRFLTNHRSKCTSTSVLNTSTRV